MVIARADEACGIDLHQHRWLLGEHRGSARHIAVEGDLADGGSGHEARHDERVAARPGHLGPHGARYQHEHFPRLRPLIEQHFARVQRDTPELVGELRPVTERQKIIEEFGTRTRFMVRPGRQKLRLERLQCLIECVREHGPIRLAGDLSVALLLKPRQPAEDKADAGLGADPRQLAQ